MAAPGTRHRAELELSDARTTGPSWTRRRWLPSWRAPRAELKLSDARAPPGPSWTRRPWLPSWHAPPGGAGAVRRTHHRGRAGSGDHGCRPGASHRAELELSCVRPTGAELELSCVRPTGAELGAATMAPRCHSRRHSEGAPRCQFRRRCGRAPRCPSWARRWSPSWRSPGAEVNAAPWPRAANSAAIPKGPRAANFRRRSERRRAAIRPAVLKGGALPELGAMAAVLARTTGPSWARRRLAPRMEGRRAARAGRGDLAPGCI